MTCFSGRTAWRDRPGSGPDGPIDRYSIDRRPLRPWLMDISADWEVSRSAGPRVDEAPPSPSRKRRRHTTATDIPRASGGERLQGAGGARYAGYLRRVRT